MRWRWRNSVAQRSMLEAISARTVMNSACRSRWMTCVESAAGARPSRLQTAASTRGIEVGMGADGAGELADPDALAHLEEPLDGAAEFVIHQGQLQAEGDRLRMDAVAAADHRDVLEFAGPPGDGRAQMVQVVQDDGAGLVELDGERGVEHVGRGQPLVNPARRGPDGSGDIFQEGDDVVIGPLLDLGDLRDGKPGLLADGAGILGGDLARARRVPRRPGSRSRARFRICAAPPRARAFWEANIDQSQPGENSRTLRPLERIKRAPRGRRLIR